MTKIKTLIFNKIGQLAIVIGIMGLVAELLNQYEYHALSSFFSVTRIFDSLLWLRYELKNFSTFPYLSILYLFIFIYGGWRYIKTNGDDSNLLKFFVLVFFYIPSFFFFLHHSQIH